MTRAGPMSVEMTNLGPLGWITDAPATAIRPLHPDTGEPWPPMPSALFDLWREHTGCEAPPDACLVNLYRGGARMGLHQDRDEADFGYPVLSISLGDTAVFRLGGTQSQRPDPLAAAGLRRYLRAFGSGPAGLSWRGPGP